LLNRKTGEGRVGTVWADAESLEIAVAKADQRRPKGVERGVQFGDDMVLEVILAAR
jgi:hypothetical protein